MINLKSTTKFRQDVKRIKKRGLDLQALDDVLTLLLQGKELPQIYLDHALKGKYIGFRECHIKSDWLLIYKIDDDNLILTALRTGTHSDLFR